MTSTDIYLLSPHWKMCCEHKREKDSHCALARWSERVGGVTRRMTCTWWLLWLSVEMPWLALGGPILALFAQIGLENTALTL